MHISEPRTAICALALVVAMGFLAASANSQDKQESKKVEPKKEDVRVLEEISGGDEVTLEGKSQKLVIKSISGGAKIDCGKLEVEEIEIESIAGGADITLKLVDKAKLKKLTIRDISGGAQVNAVELDVAQIEIGSISGGPNLKLRATGDIAFKDISGGPQITIARCRNLTVTSASGGASMDASYFGEAKVPENSSFNLKKVDPPK